MAIKKDKKVEVKKSTRPRPTEAFAPLTVNDFVITQKRSGRFQVVSSKGKAVNGDEKVKLLIEAKVLKPSEKKAVVAETAPTV